MSEFTAAEIEHSKVILRGILQQLEERHGVESTRRYAQDSLALGTEDALDHAEDEVCREYLARTAPPENQDANPPGD